MSLHDIYFQFLHGLRQTGWLEYIAVFAGIASVWFSRKENILVYPVGLINTLTYIWLSLQGHLLGEASVNFYYSVVSIYGWGLWTRKDVMHKPKLMITTSTSREWVNHLLFFGFFYLLIFFSLSYLKSRFAP